MIKAIETSYKGYRFRSRLEARWAIFFDALGVKWEYEKEGFELSTGRYLPDFWLPDFAIGLEDRVARGTFVEVKPEQPSDLEISYAAELTRNNLPCFFVVGMPDIAWGFRLPMAEVRYTLMGICRTCGAIQILWPDVSCPVCAGENFDFVFREQSDMARASRFEHGETPKVR